MDCRADQNLQRFRQQIFDGEIFPISAVTGDGIKNLLEALYRRLQEEQPDMEEDADAEIIYLPPLPEAVLSVRREGDVFLVQGHQVEKAVSRADLSSEEGQRRFQELIRRLGVEDELLKAGISEGDTVKIGDFEFLYFP